jgi:hypothetical protein
LISVKTLYVASAAPVAITNFAAFKPLNTFLFSPIFSIFDLISLPIRIYAIFNRKIKWDAIPHDDTSTLEEVNKTKDSGK